MATADATDRRIVPEPREVDFVHTKPAIKLSPAAVSDVESRVGDVRLECFDDYDRDTRIVIAITGKELKVAEYCGLIVEHPLQDTMIFFGPWACGQHADEIECCVVTKYTRPRLESGKIIEYEREASRNIAFELKEATDAE